MSEQEVNTDNLGFLGEDFQKKLCKMLIEYPDFYTSIKHSLNPNAFTIPIVKQIVCTMNDYSDKYKSVTDYTTLLMVLNSKFRMAKDREMFANEIKKLREEVSLASDREFVKEQTIHFFQQQELIKAMNNANDILAKGRHDRYQEIKGIFENALNNVHATEEIGRHQFDNIDEIFKNNTRFPIPTGISMIDERTGGGLGKKELGLICGASGFGKVQPYDAMVYTPNGFVSMREIVVGSEVIGADGKPHKVIAVFPHTHWSFYKVTFNDGVTTECGMEHLWRVSVDNEKWTVCDTSQINSALKNRDCKIYIPICKDCEPNVEKRYFKDISFSRKSDGQCILVNSEDHTYLTDDFIVTHNTSISTAIASYAGSCDRIDGKKGYKVLQIFFEDTYNQIARKYMARELNIETCMLNRYYDSVGRTRADMAYLENRIRTINENVYLHKFRDGEKSASDIEDFIRHNYIERGFQPDLVMIDYFECLAPEKGTLNMGQHERELYMMRRIEAMCGNLDCAIWVTTQGTKDSSTADIITADKISGSSSKFNVSHIAMSIMKTTEDKANNTASIALLKNRAGACGEVMTNVGFNNGTCRINTEGSEVLGFEAFKKQEEERIIKMRAYIGNLMYNPTTEDVPTTNELGFFGDGNDDNVPF